MEGEKKYSGYGYHGGGRKKLAPEARKPKKYRTLAISALPEEVEAIKAIAAERGISVSRLVVDRVLR